MTYPETEKVFYIVVTTSPMLHYLMRGVRVGVGLGFSATEKAVRRTEGRERDKNKHILARVKCKAKLRAIIKSMCSSAEIVFREFFKP